MNKVFVNIFLLLLIYSTVQANILQKTVTFQVSNIKLIDALEQLEIKAGITFSFNSNTINQNRIVSVNAQNRTLDVIVAQLLAKDNVKYYAIGTQIVIYKPKESALSTTKTPKKTNDPEDSPDTVKVIIYDTLKIIDTLKILDTIRITLFDTTQIYDTIFTTMEPIKNGTCPPSYWFIAANYHIQSFASNEMQLDIFNDSTSISNSEFAGNNLNLEFGLQKNIFFISSGFGYSEFNQDADYSIRSVAWENFSKTVTTMEYIYDSTYFVLPPLDTIWQVKKDSVLQTKTITWRERDTSYTTFNGTNSISTIYIPIAFGFEKVFQNKIVLAGRIQMNTYIVANSEGKIYDSHTNSIEPISYMTNSVFCSGMLSLGIGYEYKNLSLLISPVLNYALTNIAPENDFGNQNKNSIGANISLKYKFK